jgi:hypothetical protein
MGIGVLAGIAQTSQLARVGHAFLKELCIAVSTFKPDRVLETRGEMRRV